MRRHCNEGMILAMQSLRRDGLQSSEILNRCVSGLPDDFSLADCFLKSFGLPFSCGKYIRARKSLDDQEINKRLEQKFAEKRVGGYLTIESTAKYLGISEDRLLTLVKELGFEDELFWMEWLSPFQREKSQCVTPKVLIFLEQKYGNSVGLPWWYWDIEAKNQDEEAAIRSTLTS